MGSTGHVDREMFIRTAAVGLAILHAMFFASVLFGYPLLGRIAWACDRSCEWLFGFSGLPAPLPPYIYAPGFWWTQ